MTTATASARKHPDDQLLEDLAGFRYDPLGYAAYAFPWKMRGVDDPESIAVVPMPEKHAHRFPAIEYFLDEWAIEFLLGLRRDIQKRAFNPFAARVAAARAIRRVVSSGHGIGKSMLVGILCSWIKDCWPGSKGTVTANTGDQLRAKTWANITKWARLAITAHLWKISDGGQFIRSRDPNNDTEIVAVTWDLKNPDAFAGQHAARAISFYIFDEASGIPDKILEMAEGGLTDGQPIIILLGNMHRNSGYFHRIVYGSLRHRWASMQIDSRSCYLPNKDQIAEWIEDYGEDSDFVRTKVRGLEPNQGDKQFIPTDWVRLARRREPHCLYNDPLVMGVDFAAGGDEMVIAFRRGQDARTIPWRCFRERDEMRAVGLVTQAYQEIVAQGWKVAAIFGDGGGLGGPMMSRLEQMGYPVIRVHNGTKSNLSETRDKGAECWHKMKFWLRDGGAIPDDEILESQLVSRESYFDKFNQIFLESKEQLEERGLASPDRADALALTFAEPVHAQSPAAESDVAEDWDPYA